MISDSAAPENDSNLSGLGRAFLGTNEGSKPSGPWVPPTAEELHQILPQYEIAKMLGRGGMGAVYMGTQTALDRPVAIKILSAALEDSDAGFTERFKNEARAMAKLNHPGIVSVYDFGAAADGLLYIVMEYVDGTDVARMIAGKGRLHTEHAMAITAHVCDALAYAHERGIIHRDIKPANVMVGYDGTVKVADFGLAKVNVGGNTLGLTQSGMAMGTLHYMAPEALMLGVAVDHRADIFAVGVMLYQMLTGKVPHGMFQMPSLTVPGLDPRYDAIVARGMMEDREDRYQSARDLRGDLDGIQTQPVVRLEAEAAQPAAALPTQARPQRPAGPLRQTYQAPKPQVVVTTSSSGRPVLWLVVLALSGLAAWYFSSPRGPSPAASAALPATPPPPQPSPSIPLPESKRPQTPEPAPPAMPVPQPAAAVLVAKAPPPPADAVPAAKAAPSVPPPVPTFTNSLGMQFTGVPGTKVQFCIHETRRKDYAAYSNAVPGVNTQWQSPVYEGVVLATGDDHPVSQISWAEAKAFCDWLSNKEGRKYRLPTDREWSVAVGLGSIEPPDLLPDNAFSTATKGFYPWGTVWPPPQGSGNFADDTLARFAPGRSALAGYSDGFATTAPVMSYQADVGGLYDMAGNVSELCEDVTGWGKTQRCRRGGNFDARSEDSLISARRSGIPPGSRYPLTGFRCVLEATPPAQALVSVPAPTPAPPAVTTASETTWIDTQGRTLQANFLRLDATHVQLEVRGKKTPIAMASLSPASQQIARGLARKLARQSMRAELKWLVGGWAVFAGEGMTTGANYPAAFLADGTACHTPEAGVYHTSMWRLENDLIVVEWDDGTKWVLPVPDLRQPEKLLGEIFVKGSPPIRMVLSPRGDQGKPGTALPVKQDLAGKEFGFSSRALRQNGSRPNMRLEADGSVRLGDAGNEAAWEYEDGLLVLRAADGRPTSVFHKFNLRSGQWTCFGACLEKAATENILTVK